MFELVETGTSCPKLTINPNDGRIAVKVPKDYSLELRNRLTIFTKEIAHYLMSEIKIDKTCRGKFRIVDEKFNIQMYHESGRCTRKNGKTKTYLANMKEGEF